MPEQRTRKTNSRRKPSKRAPQAELDADRLERDAAAAAALPGWTEQGTRELTHVQKARRYIENVLSGAVPACKFVKQACARQLRDLERFADDPVFVFDEQFAGRVCRFIELLPHIKGPAAFFRKDGTPNTIALEDWQCFILTTVFGWRRKDTGGRRYRRAYVEVPRGNGKSALSSAIAIYGLTSDGEEGAEIYSAATTRDQAKIVFGDARAMLRRVPSFCAKLGVVVNDHIILKQRSNSFFIPLSREAKSLDGKSVHVVVIDELHAHPTRDVYDVLETAMAKRIASLMFIITTAGSDVSGICYEVRGYVVKLLAGVIEDDSIFGIIYTIDEDDDWMDPSVWRKANPNWGVSVMPDEFANLAKKAINMPAAQANFKTKHLNIWVSSMSAWMPLEVWMKAADSTLEIEIFKKDHALARGEDPVPCFAGLDLASKTDLAAKVLVFKRWLAADRCEVCAKTAAEHPTSATEVGAHPFTETREAHYYLFPQMYLPEQACHDGRNASYKGWEIDGSVFTTPGDVLEFARIEQDLQDDRDAFNLREVAYDPWQAAQLAQNLAAKGFDGHEEHGSGPSMIEVRATTQNFSAPMKEIDALTRQGRFHHDGNMCFTWQVGNVVCYTDAKDNIYPRKEKPENKIDGPVAAITAMNRAMLSVDDSGPYNSARGIRTL